MFILLHNSNKSIFNIQQFKAMQYKIVKTVLNIQKHFQAISNSFKTAGAVMLQLALKLQNFSIISEMLLLTKSQLCHFTNQAQGDRRGLKLMNFTRGLILYICFAINTKCKGFLMKLGIYINF